MKIEHLLLGTLSASALAFSACSAQTSTKIRVQTKAAKPKPRAQTQIATRPGARDFVWFEAESATQTNFPASSNLSPQNATEAAVLSGEKWMSVEGDRAAPLFLEYRVNVPQSGVYNFYSRKFWNHGPFRYKWDDAPWREVRKHGLLDEASLRQYVGANWVGLGEEKLTKGVHTLRVELLTNSGAAAFDAWLLTPRAFVPRGKLQPGQKYNRANAGHFAWEPDEDLFKPSAIDLRRLNEKFAGEGGFIRTKGEAFVHEKNGREVRFWAINSGGDAANLDAASMRLMARSLAKSGVNMVRFHGGVWKDSNWREPDLEKIARVRQWVQILKAEGIYTTLSIYFPLWVKPDATLAGYNGDKNPFASLFFNPDFQRVYRGWWTALMNARDSTGLAMKNDPAVAICELVNEDSYLFWTFNAANIPAPQMAILQKRFGDYLKVKYGSLDAALAKYGTRIAGDAPEEGRIGFRPLGEIASDKNQRSQDTATFLTLDQKGFFERERDFLRGLGFRAAIYASNWITADARVLGPLDKLSNTVAGTMDRHGYFSGPHEGERASYSISKGDKYADRSALLFKNPQGAADYGLPIADLRYNDLPSIITEIAWTPPNRLRADFPLLTAAYGALQGSDGAFFFASSAPSWDQTHGKFSIRTPVVQGQFPAAALIYRLGLVKPAGKIADVHLKTSDLFALKGAPVSAPANLDELRKVDIPAGQTRARVDAVDKLDPRAFLVGKVGVRFSEQDGPSSLADLSRFIDDKGKIVTSQTGELKWNYGDGLVSINAPQAQAVTGFLSEGGAIKLRDVTFSSALEYGSLALVSLDGLPISRSKRMLLQAMSEEVPFGWQTKAAAGGLQEITSLGSAPLNVKQLSGTVSLRRADAAKMRVTALDANGYPARVIGSARALKLQANTLYYLIETR